MTNTYTFGWMNGGQPFDFGPNRVTPHAARASVAHRTKALKDGLKEVVDDLRNLPPLASQAIIDSVKEEAALAQGEALLYWAFVHVDPKVKDLPIAEVMQKFDLKTYKELVDLLNTDDDEKRPLEKLKKQTPS